MFQIFKPSPSWFEAYGFRIMDYLVCFAGVDFDELEPAAASSESSKSLKAQLRESFCQRGFEDED